jgi:hypothetical protein
MQPESKKFSLDPQITSFEMLQHIIASAFNIKGYVFTIHNILIENKLGQCLTMSFV